jgi:putative oxidoreductase
MRYNRIMESGELLLVSNVEMLDLASLLGRVAVGICFVVHGLGKLGLVGTGTMAGFTEFLRERGVPMPEVQARIAMLSELVGGSLLAMGLLMRPACLLLIGTMVVAGAVGHRGAGYLITNEPPGAEYTINLVVVSIVLFLLGPGGYSLDAILF